MLTHLDCTKCEKRYEPGRVYTVCECGAPLYPRYDLARAALEMRPGHLALREPTMWRYREVLPLAEGAGAGEPRGGLHAPSRRPAARRPPRPSPARGQGGGRQPDGLVQGPRPVDGGLDGEGPRRDRRVPPLGRQRGQRPRRLRGGRRPQGPRLPAEGHRPALRDGDRGLRRPRRDGGRPHHRRGPALRGAGEGARLVRVRDAQGALPRRGQEDDGLRDRGADGLDAARRDPLPDRRRHRPRGDVEGLRRDGDDGLRRREAAPDVRGAGRGLRADRQGLPGGPRGRPLLGERHDPRPRPARARRRSATSSSCAACARATARRSPSPSRRSSRA